MNEQLQELGMRMKFLEQQMMQLDQQLQELTSVRDSIEEISQGAEGQEMLIPLGAGVFVQGTLKDCKTVKMNVGAGAVVEKSFLDAKRLVEEQIESLENIREQMTKEGSNISQNMEVMQENEE
ncbi:MAG: prefoldin subunit alpha [Nanoarchaeota archaeon]|nr:prefoldin subunit alpha [Nanoarchaeota archaeon]